MRYSVLYVYPLYIYIYTRDMIYTHVYIQMHIYIYIKDAYDLYIHIYTYIYIHIYTHIQIICMHVCMNPVPHYGRLVWAESPFRKRGSKCEPPVRRL